MTWHAQRGPTVLTGPEGSMFAEAIEEICDEISDAASSGDQEFVYGPAGFNRMTPTQQAASIELVAKALFHESPEPLPLVAWSESTLAAILGILRCWLDIEIDNAESTQIRDMLNRLTHFEVTPSKADWDSHEAWKLVLECYENQFLWDRDFESIDFLDSDPETARIMASLLGVDDDYHVAIPPDLKSDQDLAACLQRIKTLIPRSEEW